MPPPKRHYLLYARQTLRDFRTILVVFTVAYIGLGFYFAYFATRKANVAQGVQWWVSASFPLVIALLLYLYSRRTFVEFRDDGVLVRQFMRSATIPYTEIEKARLDTLEHIFDRPDRKRMQSKTVRALYQTNAVCLRIRGDADLPDELRRRLGPRTIIDREAVLPMTDTEAAMAAIKSRLAGRRQQVQAQADPARRRRRGKRR